MRLLKRSLKKTGMAPGSMVYVGKDVSTPVSVQVLTYNKTSLDIQDLKPDHIEFESAEKTDMNQWIRVRGVHKEEVIREIGGRYSLDALIMEDILNTMQRPRIESREDYTFFTLKVLTLTSESGIIEEQYSFVLFQQTLITFEQGDGDWLQPLLNRLDATSTRLRRFGVDYLLYALFDLVVDYYMECIEFFENKVEYLEEVVIRQPENEHVEQILDLKQQSLRLRQTIRPVRENLSQMLRNDTAGIKDDMVYYYNDLNDHLLHVIDRLEVQRELSIGLMDTYMSAVSQKMNEVMKVLTVIATLFIPLSFFAGVYGMNFEYMPELSWRYSYPVFWGGVMLIFIGLVVFFKKKRWI